MALVSEVADGIYQIEPEGMVNGIICMGYLVVDKWIALIEILIIDNIIYR
ncbi:MAG: hypothetical protein SVM79_00740 [Chloroflexota bacterium]|nr:hypothetical protein [Chloroflexota bacterium]